LTVPKETVRTVPRVRSVTRVQICGITTIEDALICESAGADALGFVGIQGRGRSLDLDSIGEIIDGLGPYITPILIDDASDPLDALMRAEHTGARVIQTYGLDIAGMERLRDCGIGVVAVVPVDLATGVTTVPDLATLTEVASFILFEPSLDGKTGGLGVGFDVRESLDPLLTGIPRFGIAGGLTPENVHSVLPFRPYVVDVSSGVELEKGRKDPELVRRFVRTIREHDLSTVDMEGEGPPSE